jgi:transcriptional regulator with XRE-family HTH domain
MEDRQFLAVLGARIKELRISKGISQKKLADGCGFEKASMSRIESGRTNPTALTLRKISTVLNIHLSEFFPNS